MRIALRWAAQLMGHASILLGGAAAGAHAQDNVAAPRGGPPWEILAAVGYGGLGFGLGALAGTQMPSDDYGPSGAALVTIAGTSVAGIVTGAVIGSRARRVLAQPRLLTANHRVALVSGVILAGATVGAAAAVPLINPEGEGTALGSDERTFAIVTAAGTAVAVLYVARQWDRITGAGVGVGPALRGDGQYAVNVQLRATFASR